MKGHRSFVGLILAITLGTYLALLGFGHSRLYCSYSHSFVDAAACYQPEVRGQRADILLVGDSSLLYSIRPSLVSAAGGGSSYNLGTVGPSFGFSPETMIDRYLAHNQKPKAIILYFSPGHLISSKRIIDPRWAPLGLLMLQNGSPAEIGRFLRAMPSAIGELPPIILNNFSFHAGLVPAIGAQMAADGGHLDYSRFMSRVLPAACEAPSDVRAGSYPDNRLALAALRSRYRAKGIGVFVYVAPTAACDGQISAIRANYRAVADNIPQAGAAALFADDGSPHVHPSPAGVEAFSRQLAGFIRTNVQPAIAVR